MGAEVGDDDSEDTGVEDDIEEEAFVIKHGYIEDLYGQTNDAVLKAIRIVVLALDAVAVSNRKDYEGAVSDVVGVYEECRSAYRQFETVSSVLRRAMDRSKLGAYIVNIARLALRNTSLVESIMNYVKNRKRRYGGN